MRGRFEFPELRRQVVQLAGRRNVDLTLIDLGSGKELEMGTPFDTFSPAAHTANATGEAAANRQRLKAAMEREGFTNYDQEWWHYTLDVANPLRFDRVIQ